MATKKLQLRVVTPERLILEEEVDQVTLPTVSGELTILPDHVPIIIKMASGDVVAKVNGELVPIAVVGGFLEVKHEDGHTKVALLADFAEHLHEMTDDKIEQAKARAEELRQQMENKELVDFEHFETELERSLTRVKIADKWRSKKYRK